MNANGECDTLTSIRDDPAFSCGTLPSPFQHNKLFYSFYITPFVPSEHDAMIDQIVTCDRSNIAYLCSKNPMWPYVATILNLLTFFFNSFLLFCTSCPCKVMRKPEDSLCCPYLPRCRQDSKGGLPQGQPAFLPRLFECDRKE